MTCTKEYREHIECSMLFVKLLSVTSATQRLEHGTG